MLMPSIFDEKLFDNWFDFPMFGDYDNTERKLYGRHADRLMKTDVHENDDHYEVDIDLPGFKKEEISLELDNGYLTVSAAKGLDKDETDHRGKLIRQERYSGSMQRSFYVGENLTEEDIKATFRHGVLSLNVPKKEQAKVPEKKMIMIEG
ncbi:Hsp20/alpha crystallin family protein [Butyrivibrio sp. LC3010]|uniref:Hsp20/alpha crystallin family protein n=1 Tax=Butyrivibrio sp. LC3010 TaxID=1280680 RepID=UPI0003F68861|nr:Hsp20/alpha crystallin family protein [Butyrivibrio sp. LC3010]